MHKTRAPWDKANVSKHAIEEGQPRSTLAPDILQITETASTDLFDSALREVVVDYQDTGVVLNLSGHCNR
jgi:hypothetical protein